MEPRRSLEEAGLGLFLLGVIAGLIAVFIKGSRPLQPLDADPPTTPYPLANALVAIFSPALSVLVFYLGVWTHFTNNRVFDLLIALPLINGAYCGRRAFRSTLARIPVRALGLLAIIVCIPGALVFLVITIFGVG